MELTNEKVSLLRDPLTHDPICLSNGVDQGEGLLATPSGRRFPVRRGIPVLLEDGDAKGQNQKYQKLYDRFAGFYDLGIWLFALFGSGGLEKRRKEYLDEMELKEGARVLEVSVGTGMNLRFLPKTARYLGLDISWGMLKRCQRNLKRWGIDAFLVQGAAEHLPFVRIPLKSAACSEIESHFPTQPIPITETMSRWLYSVNSALLLSSSVSWGSRRQLEFPSTAGGPWIPPASGKCSSEPPRASVFARRLLMPAPSCFPCLDGRRACAPIRL